MSKKVSFRGRKSSKACFVMGATPERVGSVISVNLALNKTKENLIIESVSNVL